jgi:hypothetical protein
VSDEASLREHAATRLTELVGQAFDASVPEADINEVILDIAAGTDPASLPLAELSQIIVALSRLIRAHTAPADESDADKQARAELLARIQVEISTRSANDAALAAVVGAVQRVVGDDGDLMRLELPRLHDVLTVVQGLDAAA